MGYEEKIKMRYKVIYKSSFINVVIIIVSICKRNKVIVLIVFYLYFSCIM